VGEIGEKRVGDAVNNRSRRLASRDPSHVARLALGLRVHPKEWRSTTATSAIARHGRTIPELARRRLKSRNP
jgi:hypothetical protein